MFCLCNYYHLSLSQLSAVVRELTLRWPRLKKNKKNPIQTKSRVPSFYSTQVNILRIHFAKPAAAKRAAYRQCTKHPPADSKPTLASTFLSDAGGNHLCGTGSPVCRTTAQVETSEPWTDPQSRHLLLSKPTSVWESWPHDDSLWQAAANVS